MQTGVSFAGGGGLTPTDSGEGVADCCGPGVNWLAMESSASELYLLIATDLMLVTAAAIITPDHRQIYLK
jgi:hypothetical protein